MTALPFQDRADAARQLAAALAGFRSRHPVVLAIPRGAVPMGRIVADALGGALDVVLVRKLGAPGNPELAIGAIDEQGRITLNALAGLTGATPGHIEREAAHQRALIQRRRAQYRPGQPPTPLAGRCVIVLDDGLATGATMAAALQAVRRQRPATLVCAVPVASREGLDAIDGLADRVVCLATPAVFPAVGAFYRDFETVEDAQVIEILDASAGPDAATPATTARHVRLPAGAVWLDGDLDVPADARGVVLFAHGSGSSRHSPRNRAVADALRRRGFATLLFDLLTPEEDRDRARRFDIALLARRLSAALDRVRGEAGLAGRPVGLFGASTGAAAALQLAAARPEAIAAVVSRGGRPDLAGPDALRAVRAPTLLVVGGDDTELLALNRAVQGAIGPHARLAVVPGATHLFEEPGTLEAAATLAADWFGRHC